MRLMLEEDLSWCKTLGEVQQQTQATLSELRIEGYSIHYVAGPISCDGEENIPDNLEKLIHSRKEVMQALGKGSLVFTAPFIFSLEPQHDSYNRLGLFNIDKSERETKLQQFWDELIISGVVDGIHFVRGWERSPGARQERLTATLNQVPIYDL